MGLSFLLPKKVKIFFKNIQSCVINTGFALERGIRQRDPLSSYLAVLVVEVLAIAVRQNTSIRGISIDGQETKLLQYADDTKATLTDFSSARAFFDLLNTFKLFSGLAVNYSKTEGMWIGSCRHPSVTDPVEPGCSPGFNKKGRQKSTRFILNSSPGRPMTF